MITVHYNDNYLDPCFDTIVVPISCDKIITPGSVLEQVSGLKLRHGITVREKFPLEPDFSPGDYSYYCIWNHGRIIYLILYATRTLHTQRLKYRAVKRLRAVRHAIDLQEECGIPQAAVAIPSLIEPQDKFLWSNYVYQMQCELEAHPGNFHLFVPNWVCEHCLSTDCAENPVDRSTRLCASCAAANAAREARFKAYAERHKNQSQRA